MIAKNGVDWEEWGFTVYGECPEYKGYIKRARTNDKEKISYLPSYMTWERVIYRGRWDGKKVCEEWKDFQNFRKWYDENYYEIQNEDMELFYNFFDKDNIFLSPDTCIYLPRRIKQLRRYLDKGVLFDYIVTHESEMPKKAYDKMIEYCLENG